MKGTWHCDRSSHQRCSIKTGVLKKFSKFTGKHLRGATLLKKRLWHRYFPVNFAKFPRMPYLQDTSGPLLLIVRDKYTRAKKVQSVTSYLTYFRPIFI